MVEAIPPGGAYRSSARASWSTGIRIVALALFAVIAFGNVVVGMPQSAYGQPCGSAVTGVEGVADHSTGSCPQSLACPFEVCAQSAVLFGAEGPLPPVLAGWEKPSAAPRIRSRWRVNYRPPRGSATV